MKVWDWRDGWTGKSTCYIYRETELSSQHPGWVANNCLGVSNSLWRHLTLMHIPTHRYMPTHPLKYLCILCVFVCACRRAVGFLDLTLGMVVSHRVGLGTELESFPREVSDLNCWAISSDLKEVFKNIVLRAGMYDGKHFVGISYCI